MLTFLILFYALWDGNLSSDAVSVVAIRCQSTPCSISNSEHESFYVLFMQKRECVWVSHLMSYLSTSHDMIDLFFDAKIQKNIKRDIFHDIYKQVNHSGEEVSLKMCCFFILCFELL